MANEESPTKVRPVRIARGPRPGELACIEVLTGTSSGRLLGLTTGTTLIGRTPACDLALDDDGVSRQHAKLSVTEDGIVNLLDLQSTNGTYLNNSRVDVGVVRPGDRILIGSDVELRFDYRQREELTRSNKGRRGIPRVELSKREREVAVLVAEGLTNGEIAKRLFISVRTVTTHLGSIYESLGSSSRATLTRYVLEHDLDQ